MNDGEQNMRSDYFRTKAEHCRAMLKLTASPEAREQLRLWADDFDRFAETAAEQGERGGRSRATPSRPSESRSSEARDAAD